MARQKTALVTGASSGIGYQLAIELAHAGYKTFACARRLDRLKPLEQHDVQVFTMDVTDQVSVAHAAQLVYKETDGYLDVLFNNAGVPCGAALLDATDEQIDRVFGTNVHGVMRVTREFAKLVINAKGTVAITGSVAGKLPVPFLGVYAMSKAAIYSYAQVLRLELAPFGVAVKIIVSGSVKSDIAASEPVAEHSLYRVDGYDDFAEAREKSFADQSQQMDTDVYAKKVVADVLGRSTQLEHYRGQGALAVWWLTSFFPHWVVEHVAKLQFVLGKMWASIAAKYAETKL